MRGLVRQAGSSMPAGPVALTVLAGVDVGNHTTEIVIAGWQTAVVTLARAGVTDRDRKGSRASGLMVAALLARGRGRRRRGG